jgi:hypothetical protein
MSFLLSILKNQDFPILAQNVGLALLTILIPIAIAIFTTPQEFKELDNHVILDHIIKARGLLVYCALIFLLPFFWSHSALRWRLPELVLWILGVVYLTKILIRSYFWVKGNKFPFRFDFLSKLKSPHDTEESWSSVWQSSINSRNENEFFGIFSKRLDELLKNE